MRDEDDDFEGEDAHTGAAPGDAVPEMTVAQARAALCGVAMLSGPALRALAELAGHIGPRRFPNAFAEDEIVPDQPSRKAASPWILEKVRVISTLSLPSTKAAPDS